MRGGKRGIQAGVRRSAGARQEAGRREGRSWTGGAASEVKGGEPSPRLLGEEGGGIGEAGRLTRPPPRPGRPAERMLRG